MILKNDCGVLTLSSNVHLLLISVSFALKIASLLSMNLVRIFFTSFSSPWKQSNQSELIHWYGTDAVIYMDIKSSKTTCWIKHFFPACLCIFQCCSSVFKFFQNLFLVFFICHNLSFVASIQSLILSLSANIS